MTGIWWIVESERSASVPVCARENTLSRVACVSTS